MALTKIKTGSVSDSITLTTPDINGGTIDATLIGGTTPAAATFTTGTFNAGATFGAAVTVEGPLAIRNATQSFFGGLSAEVNSGIINLGVNEGSVNRFGGAYTQANQGGMLHFDTRAGNPLFQLYGRTAGTAASTGSILFQIDSTGNTVFNETGADADFRVESDTNTHALFVEGSTGRLFSGGSATSSSNTWSVLSGSQYIKKAGTAVYDVLQFYNDNGICGQIYLNGSSTVYATSSDYRIKENVVPMTGSIDRVKALKPSRFNFIVDADRTVDGFIAHEVQAVVPEAISGTKDAMKDEEYEVTAAVEEVRDEDDNVTTEAAEAVMGTRSVPDMQGIDQSKLVPLLVAALQEAIARIEILEGA